MSLWGNSKMPEVDCERTECENNEIYECAARGRITIDANGCQTFREAVVSWTGDPLEIAGLAAMAKSMEDKGMQIVGWGNVDKTSNKARTFAELRDMGFAGVMVDEGTFTVSVPLHERVFGRGPVGLVASTVWGGDIWDKLTANNGATMPPDMRRGLAQLEIICLNSEAWGDGPERNTRLKALLAPFVQSDVWWTTDPMYCRHELPRYADGTLTHASSWQFCDGPPWEPENQALDAALCRATGKPLGYLCLEFGTEQGLWTPSSPDCVRIAGLVATMEQPPVLAAWGIWQKDDTQLAAYKDAVKAGLTPPRNPWCAPAYAALPETMRQIKALAELLQDAQQLPPQVKIYVDAAIYGRGKYDAEFRLTQAAAAATRAGLQIGVTRNRQDKGGVLMVPEEGIAQIVGRQTWFATVDSRLPNVRPAQPEDPRIPTPLEAVEQADRIGRTARDLMLYDPAGAGVDILKRAHLLRGQAALRQYQRADGTHVLAVVNCARTYGPRAEAEGGYSRLDLGVEQWVELALPATWTSLDVVTADGPVLAYADTYRHGRFERLPVRLPAAGFVVLTAREA